MWTIDLVPFDDEDAAALRAAQRVELDARYGSDDHEPGTVPSAVDVPVFLVARSEDTPTDTPTGRTTGTATGTPIACGGLRPLGPELFDGTAVEVKRMYVAPAARGSGVAAAVLRELERHAAGLGAERVVLETGTMQPDAMRFYEREGYTPIPRYGHYADSELSVCYERVLEP
ncbi:GNAT family N-acetyltransferase [Curtobacterium sp. RRHDQ66]|uniref:GNAT family N-acetyltransferase n=1 Tax=Curtobacterium guangdongense TaxID=3413380 RepID=UPI003BF03802